MAHIKKLTLSRNKYLYVISRLKIIKLSVERIKIKGIQKFLLQSLSLNAMYLEKRTSHNILKGV